MPWVQVIDKFPGVHERAVVAEMYQINALPYYVLIDKEGRLMLATDSAIEMRKKVDELFR
jgi:hypothetical protein